jgi:glycosyltransferase involved in cell wall biosynthesis
MAAQLEKSGSAPRERIEVIHNWADGEAIRPVERGANRLRREWQLDRDFVVGYSGNLGRVHEFDTMLAAASRLKQEPGVRFVIIGRGPRLAEVQARVRDENLSNVRFEPHQDRDALGLSLGVADVHLSVLQPGFEGLVHPSKLYGIMAAGRPTIFVGDTHGETAAILAATRSGVSVRTGDVDGLVAAIVAMRDGDDERSRMGEAARRAFDERFAMPIALRQWRDLIGAVGYKGS